MIRELLIPDVCLQMPKTAPAGNKTAKAAVPICGSPHEKMAAKTTEPPPAIRTHHPAWLLAGFWVCFAISIAVVLRRLSALANPSQSSRPGMANMDATFASHPLLTMAHIVPAAIFVVLAAFVLLGRKRRAWLEQLFFAFGAVTGLTAYAMNAYAIGGWIERSAVLVFNSLFLFSLARAYLFRMAGNSASQRRWMVRAVGVLLGIATTRPVMGVFFATSGLTHLQPRQFFGIAFWIGFSINVLITELWLRSATRARIRLS